MHERPTLPPFAAVIVAAGKGLRVGGEVPKQFRSWRGKPLVRHSAERMKAHGAQHILVAIAPDAEDIARRALDGIEGITFVEGGETRQDSVRAALLTLEGTGCDRVLIHDAARPDLPQSVTQTLVNALDTHQGAIPVLPVVDSLVLVSGGIMAGTAPRETMRRVQTPQAFRFDAILAAHKAWRGASSAGDDAQVLAAVGGQVALVEGSARLKKITFAEDFMNEAPAIRVGQGFDVHRLASGEDLWLGGIQIAHDKGLAGHSDADVALHALVDAVLGAAALGDIGSHFPPSDPQWKGAASSRFVTHAATLVREAGYAISNVDLTIICEAPKIGPHRDAMRARIAELLAIDITQVSVKATTTERLGFAGRGEGIAAQALATLTTQSAI